MAYNKDSSIHYITKRTKGTGSKVVVDEGQHITFLDFDNDKKRSDFRVIGLTDFEAMTHEAQHMYDFDKGIISANPNRREYINGIDIGELRAVKTENRARRLHHRPIRTKYNGLKIDRKYL